MEEVNLLSMGIDVRVDAGQESVRRLANDPCMRQANENMVRFNQLYRQYKDAYGVPNTIFAAGEEALNAAIEASRPLRDRALRDTIEQALREGIWRFAGNGLRGYTSLPEGCSEG